MTRAQKIEARKLWLVYPDKQDDKILFEGSRTACLKFIREKFGMRQYKHGTIRLAQLIFENAAIPMRPIK